MSDFKHNEEFNCTKIEALKEQLKQLEPAGFNSNDFEATLSSVRWEIKNVKEPDEKVEDFLKKSGSNGIRILYTGDRYKPIFKDESEFGITEGSINDFYIELATQNVIDAIHNIVISQSDITRETPLKEIATKMNGVCMVKEVAEKDYDLKITDFEIPMNNTTNIKILARTIQSKHKNTGQLNTQSEILFVKIPCEDFARYLRS